jgi:hypothetical protein
MQTAENSTTREEATATSFLVTPADANLEDALAVVALLLRRLADREDAGLEDHDLREELREIQRRYRSFENLEDAVRSAGPGETVLPYPAEDLWRALDREWTSRGSLTSTEAN